MTFAIAGATGRLRPLIRVLLEPGHRVRALTRKCESPIASELRSLGAEIWRGDFDEPETLAAAATGADALFAAGTAHRVGPDGEVRHGVAAADADGLARLFDWLDRIGDQVDIATLHARYPQVGWHSFERWAEAQDWERLANPGRAA
jgi:nucleoside-diphosphate-sugar epimerase